MPATARSLWSHAVDAAGLLATPLRPSHYLELLNPLWSARTLRARVEGVWDETASARTLTLRPGRGWRRHRAGQWIRVSTSIGGMRHTRTYSIASSPEAADGRISITVKETPGGRVSPFLVRSLQPGSYLGIGPAQGTFVLPDAIPVRPLFLTAGSGITPVMSMLRTAALRDAMPSTVHLHYAPDARDVIFGKELGQIAATHPPYRLHTVYTRDGAPGPRHFSAAQLEAFCPDWRERDVWACGPQSFLAAVESHWSTAGRMRQLNIEHFHAPRALLPADAAGGRVRFAASACEADATADTSLLRVAEDAGLTPPHGCRMGICHTCDTTLLSGCVRDLRTGRLYDEPGQRVQPCVYAAAGDVTLDL